MEAEFLAEIAANPDDWTPRLVLADWLEERGDPRAEMIRLQHHLLHGHWGEEPAATRLLELIAAGVVTPCPRMAMSGGTELLLIPPGEFLMGGPKDEPVHYDSETQVQVTLTTGFWLGKSAVTQGEWQRVMGTTPWTGQQYVVNGANYPATYISHVDTETGEVVSDSALAFCQQLTVQEQKAGRLPANWEYRLPTEAEWEYACRAGTHTAYSFGDDPDRLKDYGWYRKNCFDLRESYSHRVGLKRANAWGLQDMHGNVWEWCATIESSGWYGVSRGGSWDFSAGDCRSADRRRFNSSNRGSILGFRVALSPPGQAGGP